MIVPTFGVQVNPKPYNKLAGIFSASATGRLVGHGSGLGQTCEA